MRRLGERLLVWGSDQSPWTNVYGLGRSILALSTAFTLAASAGTTLFRPAAGIVGTPFCEGLPRFALFCLVDQVHIDWSRWAAVMLLLVTASGWRPRFTAIPHWWISFSLQTSATTLDGGDQVALVLTTLLLPVALTDSRKWHWATLETVPGRSAPWPFASLVAASALLACRIQVAAIYFHAAVGKMGVTEWVDGTALYYWLSDPMFGLSEPLLSWAWPLLSTSMIVTGLTWSVMLLELSLAAALTAPKRVWPAILVVGILFHVTIYLIHGLASFSLTMVGALILYLRPPEQEFELPAIVAARRFLWKRGAVPEGGGVA